MSTDKRKLNVLKIRDSFIERYQNKELSLTDLKVIRDQKAEWIDTSNGVIEDRIRELVNWLISEENGPEIELEEFCKTLLTYHENGFIVTNHGMAWDDLTTMLKAILGKVDEKGFYVSEPAYLLEGITDIGRKVSKTKKQLSAIDMVLTDISEGRISVTSVQTTQKKSEKTTSEEVKDVKDSRIPVEWADIFELMDKFTSQGYSVLASAKEVERIIGGKRKAGSIRNKYSEIKNWNNRK